LVSMVDSPKRFSKRAENCDKFRPRYPDTLMSYLERGLGFSQKSIVADIGSGTGILSEMFLRNGNIVFGSSLTRTCAKSQRPISVRMPISGALMALLNPQSS
jgi:2-polyprenyl-3-methyl-5-hydroxy-6-metoxy-1,4-benzoquinol methylase